LLDRFDIHIEVSQLSYDELHAEGDGEMSSEIARRVAGARNLQQERLRLTNARMNGAMTREICRLDSQSQQLLKRVFDDNRMSARAYDRVLRVARSIADLDQAEDIRPEHIAESVSYRVLDLTEAEL
jgi:magnesium chelatase family protein